VKKNIPCLPSIAFKLIFEAGDVLGGGFKHFLPVTLSWGDDPINIFFTWVGSTTT